MKKILGFIIVLWILIFQFNTINYSNAACDYSPSWDVTDLVGACMKDTKVIQVESTGLIEDWFKIKIQKWTNNIALFLALLSVGSVIYGGLMMTLSVWEDEKIKKAKDIVKWALVWFLGVVLATTIVTLVINVIYWLAKV